MMARFWAFKLGIVVTEQVALVGGAPTFIPRKTNTYIVFSQQSEWDEITEIVVSDIRWAEDEWPEILPKNAHK